MTADKRVGFDEFLVSVIKLLDISIDDTLVDEVINRTHYRITVRQFLNKALKTKGWQDVMTIAGGYIIDKKMFDEGTINATKTKAKDAKANMLYFWEGICIDALKSGYTF